MQYLGAHGGGVVTVDAEAATNRMALMLSSWEPEREYSKPYDLHLKINILDRTLKIGSL